MLKSISTLALHKSLILNLTFTIKSAPRTVLPPPCSPHRALPAQPQHLAAPLRPQAGHHLGYTPHLCLCSCTFPQEALRILPLKMSRLSLVHCLLCPPDYLLCVPSGKLMSLRNTSYLST